jgi:hypothetical protein
MELRNFPFDAQHLFMVLKCKTLVMNGVPIEFEHHSERTSVVHNIWIPNWKLLVKRESTPVQFYVGHTSRQASTQQVEYPILALGFSLERHSKFFVWNCLGLAFLITSMAAYTYWIPLDDTGEFFLNRATFITGIILAVISLKFTFQQSLPKVGYMTKFDKYFWLCIVFLSIKPLGDILLVESARTDGHLDLDVDVLVYSLTLTTLDAVLNTTWVFCWLLAQLKRVRSARRSKRRDLASLKDRLRETGQSMVVLADRQQQSLRSGRQSQTAMPRLRAWSSRRGLKDMNSNDAKGMNSNEKTNLQMVKKSTRHNSGLHSEASMGQV